MTYTEPIKPIRTEDDYEAALEELDALFHAEEGSEEADRRDVLAVLIEDYEDEHYAIDLPDPVEAVRFRMEQQGLTQKDLVRFIGSKSKVSEVLSGKRRLSLRMIRELHSNLGIPAEVLLRDSQTASLEPVQSIDVSTFPVSELAKLGAFDQFGIDEPRRHPEECIHYLLEKIGGETALPVGLARQSPSPRLQGNVSPSGLLAWSLYVLALAADGDEVPAYEPGRVDEEFATGLAQLSVLQEGPRLAREYLGRHGIHLIVAKHLRRTYLDGASFITRDGRPIIGMTLRYDRVDNFWFTLMHELAHVALHLDVGHYIADDLTLRNGTEDTETEREADRWAESALLPEDFTLEEWDSASAAAIRQYALARNRHPAIVAGHIQYRTRNYRRYSQLVGHGDVRRWFEGAK